MALLEVLDWGIAAYAAVLSTYLGYKHLKADRARLQFRLSVDYPDAAVDARRTGDWGLQYLKMRVINTGRRPIAIDAVGVIYRLDLRRARIDAVRTADRRDAWVSFDSPRVLGEYDLVDALEVGDAARGQMLHNWPEGPWHLWEAFAMDASGVVHRQRLHGWYEFGHEADELDRRAAAYQHGLRSWRFVLTRRLARWRAQAND
jgi:hypothetical protein